MSRQRLFEWLPPQLQPEQTAEKPWFNSRGFFASGAHNKHRQGFSMYTYADLQDETCQFSGEVTLATDRHKGGYPKCAESTTKPNEYVDQPIPKVTSKPKRRPCTNGADFTLEDRIHGGHKCAANKRERIHAAIDANLFTHLQELRCTSGQRFVMVRFLEQVVPLRKNYKAMVQRYGSYIKAKLKGHEAHPAVVGLARFVDKIRKAQAVKAGKAFTSMFSRISGEIIRISSSLFCTYAARVGAAWLAGVGVWGWYQNHETGECCHV